VQSRNIYGFGSFSNEASIESSDVPDQPDKPTTLNTGTDVQISWQGPNDNSDPISGYEILI